MGETSIEKLHAGSSVRTAAVQPIDIQLSQNAYAKPIVPVKKKAKSMLEQPVYKSATPVSVQKVYTPFSNTSYAARPMDFPPRPIDKYPSLSVGSDAPLVEMTAPVVRSGMPVYMNNNVPDNGEDDYWNQDGTGPFDHSGDVGHAPLADAILFLCLLALLYAASIYFHTKRSTTEK